MVKTLAALAVAMGILAAAAGSAFAECGSTSHSVSLDTQTASTGSSGGQTPSTPQPATSSD